MQLIQLLLYAVIVNYVNATENTFIDLPQGYYYICTAKINGRNIDN